MRETRRVLLEDVAEARTVAELTQLRSQRSTMRAILRRRHVAHIGFPSSRVASALQVWPTTTSDGRRVFVTIEAVARRYVAHQQVASFVRAAPIHDQPARPATA